MSRGRDVCSRRCVVFGLVLALAALDARAQIPDRFTNLRVLPKDIPRAELIRTMRSWAGELGVRCASCHVGPDNLQGMDFASDEKPTKQAAREMIRLVETFNNAIDRGLPAREGAPRDHVSCYTCHRLELRPPRPMHEELLRTARAGGASAAAERYRELRRTSELTGKYDFGLPPIAYAAMRLLEEGRAEEALGLAQLGREQNPRTADAWAVLGEVQHRRGDRAAARDSYRQAVELDPAHAVARRLKELEAAPEEPKPAP